MFTTYYPPYSFGGDAEYLRALVQLLCARGHEVTVVHCEDAYRLASNAQPDQSIAQPVVPGLTVRRLKSRMGALSPLVTQQTGYPGLKSAAIAEILEEPFDVVHFHNVSLIGGPGLLLRTRSASVNIYTTHEHWLVCPTHILWKNDSYACDKPTCTTCCLRSGIPPQLWRYTNLLSRSIRRLDFLLSPSHFTAQLHQSIAGDTPIEVLPLFSRLQSPRSLPSPGGDYFVFAGRLVKSKGVEPMLEAFDKTTHHLKIAGTGPLRDSLSERFSHNKRIEFCGQVAEQELAELFTHAAALVLPSLAPETFGLTSVEAMSCGTPAIVRDAGGAAESVRFGGAGAVFSEFSELPALLDEMVHPEKLERLAKSALRTYNERYTPEAHVTRYLDLIDQYRAGKTCAR